MTNIKLVDYDGKRVISLVRVRSYVGTIVQEGRVEDKTRQKNA